jgi:hypothetical protein
MEVNLELHQKIHELCGEVFGSEEFLKMKESVYVSEPKQESSQQIGDSELTTERNFMKKFNQNFNPSDNQVDSNENHQTSQVVASFNDSLLNKKKDIGFLNQSENLPKLNVSGLRISNMYKQMHEQNFPQNIQFDQSKKHSKSFNVSNNEPFLRMNSLDYFRKGTHYKNQLTKMDMDKSVDPQAKIKFPNLSNLSKNNSSQSQNFFISQSSKPSGNKEVPRYSLQGTTS